MPRTCMLAPLVRQLRMFIVTLHIIPADCALPCSRFVDLVRIFCAPLLSTFNAHSYLLFLYLFIYLIHIAHNIFTVMTTLSQTPDAIRTHRCRNHMSTIARRCVKLKRRVSTHSYHKHNNTHNTPLNVPYTAIMLSSMHLTDAQHMHTTTARYTTTDVYRHHTYYSR